MDLDAINRRITAIENKQHVNYSSISGTAYQLSYNGNNLTIESDGTITSNTVIVAENLAEDNEERLQAVEEFCENVETALDNKADKDHNHDDRYALIEHTHTLSEITDYSDSGNSSCDFCFLLMTDLISSYIKTAVQDHTHTKSDITDLNISESILSSSTSTLTEGTNYFDITLELTTISGIEVYLFKFTNTEEFSADKFSSFNLLITDSNSETVIKEDMGYSDN